MSRIKKIPRKRKNNFRYLTAVCNSLALRVETAFDACFEKRKRNSIGKKTINARPIKLPIRSASGTPGILSLWLKAVRKVPVIMPSISINPINMKPATERNILHLLATLRFLRVTGPISIFRASGIFSIGTAY